MLGEALGRGRSIFRFVDIDTADVVEAVCEFFEDEKMSAAAVEREDVRPQTRGVIRKMDESEELSCALGAFERVVCEVCEVALNGSFVGKYHI